MAQLLSVKHLNTLFLTERNFLNILAVKSGAHQERVPAQRAHNEDYLRLTRAVACRSRSDKSLPQGVASHCLLKSIAIKERRESRGNQASISGIHEFAVNLP